MVQRGHCGRLGHGCTTGHQNRSADKKKQMCSTSCQVSECKVSSYGAGRCQPRVKPTKMIQEVRGWVSQSPSCLNGRQLRNGPNALRAIGRGRPVSNGRNGLPSKSNGGATIMNSRC